MEFENWLCNNCTEDFYTNNNGGAEYCPVCTSNDLKMRCKREYVSKAKLDKWQELFFLIKSDHEKNENEQTNEWMAKARDLGIDI